MTVVNNLVILSKLNESSFSKSLRLQQVSKNIFLIYSLIYSLIFLTLSLLEKNHHINHPSISIASKSFTVGKNFLCY